MKRVASLLFALLPAAAAATDTTPLRGTVIGFTLFAGDSRCYVAINDASNEMYGNGYHQIKDQAMCSVAKAAYFIGAMVVASKAPVPGEANEILDIEMIKDW